MLWVLKKRLNDSSFDQPKHMFKLMSKKNIYTFTFKIFVYLNLYVFYNAHNRVKCTRDTNMVITDSPEVNHQ